VGDSLIPISDEQAKLGQELVGAGRDAGGWLADFLGELPRDLLGLLAGDKVKVRRAERLAKLWDEAKKRLADQGIGEPTPANPKLVLPILAAAADENNEELQDLWARLLAAAMNPDQSKQGRLRFTDALKKLDPLDARVLIWMHGHGDSTNMGKQNKMSEELGVSRDEVDVSVNNLVKANFAGPAGMNPFTGQSNTSATLIGLTPFGREFLRIVLVSVPNLVESCESVVIQGR
jgi:DNA-binding MarR family transcriptional regulator